MLDPEMRERLAKLNPTASAKVANRLLEAQERRYWQPDDATLEALRHATLSAQCAAHPAAKEARDLDLERERLARQRSRRAGKSASPAPVAPGVKMVVTP